MLLEIKIVKIDMISVMVFYVLLIFFYVIFDVIFLLYVDVIFVIRVFFLVFDLLIMFIGCFCNGYDVNM